MAFKNRKLELPEAHQELYESTEEEDGSVEKIAHTDQMR